MDKDKMYGIKEAADKLGISWATVRRRIKDKTIAAMFVSRREGYKVSEEELNKYAEKLKANPVSAGKKANKKSVENKVIRSRVKAKKPVKKAETTAVETPKAQSGAIAVKEFVAVSSDNTTEMLVGGQLGVALSAILGAYSSVGELSLPEESVKNLIKELNNATVIDKVIDRLKAEQEYYDIQTASLELKVKETAKKDAKAQAEQQLIEMRLKKNQIGKDITDLEIRKTLLG